MNIETAVRRYVWACVDANLVNMVYEMCTYNKCTEWPYNTFHAVAVEWVRKTFDDTLNIDSCENFGHAIRAHLLQHIFSGILYKRMAFRDAPTCVSLKYSYTLLYSRIHCIWIGLDQVTIYVEWIHFLLHEWTLIDLLEAVLIDSFGPMLRVRRMFVLASIEMRLKLQLLEFRFDRDQSMVLDSGRAYDLFVHILSFSPIELQFRAILFSKNGME